MSVYESKYKSGWYARCDVCGYIQEKREWQEYDDRAEVWIDMKHDGWSFRKKDGKWIHYCPSCVEAMQSAKRDAETKKRRAYFEEV